MIGKRCLTLCALAVAGSGLARPAEPELNIALNRACYQSAAADYDHTAHLVTDGHADTYWMSRDEAAPWIYVDLGAELSFDRAVIRWGTCFASDYTVETASSGTPVRPEGWRRVARRSGISGGVDSLRFGRCRARYVRIRCENPNRENLVICEFSIFGPERFAAAPRPEGNALIDGRYELRNNDWVLQRSSYVEVAGERVSALGFDTEGWIPARVPGTVLGSYLAIGALPDPNYGAQQLMISDEFFTADFWYRNEFDLPTEFAGRRIWLNFDGVNWKADVFVNGIRAGRIEGAFIRSSFDVTELVRAGERNAVAVLVFRNDNPGAVTEQHLNDPDDNGGIIGLDSPTFLASIGWNWMPTIRGRNTGIWNDVYLSATDDVVIVDPFVKTLLPLPDTSRADLEIEVGLENRAAHPVEGWLEGAIGEVEFSLPVSLPASGNRTVRLTPQEFPQLRFEKPRLWWPNGYGGQPLYTLDLTFRQGERVSDNERVVFGIRQYAYTVVNNNFRIWVNGHPILVRGGNWGMADAMLHCDAKRYDTYVRLHKEMNLNMIRNWIGMEGDDEFYEACDRYGILIWDDFWLANPVDGPHPTDNAMFMRNVCDKIRHFRNHASVSVWTGRNEGYPPAALDSAMRYTTGLLDGTRYYLSSSAHAPVTGLGPYETKDPKWYLTHRGTTFHSEQGIVTPPNLESIRAMMPAESLWPINDMWGLHDWTQPRVQIFTDDMTRSYGEARSIEDFCRKAQMLNMEGPKALMESWQSNRGPGVMVWMSHPAWPSLICQTYDYYYEPTAAYFAFKTACEPVHVMWRADNEKVQVVNNTLGNLKDLKVRGELYDLDGRLVGKFESAADAPSNSVNDVRTMTYPAEISSVHFIRLTLHDSAGSLLSSNFYWRGTEYLDYRELSDMAQAEPEVSVSHKRVGGREVVTVSLDNTTDRVVLMLRMLLVDRQTGERILPAVYGDNYLSLVPGESREVSISFDALDRSREYSLLVEGWNTPRNSHAVRK
ncbi:hypothetical protein B5E60_05325 [Alistipes sp. An116]|uniref:glycosyl hydrolase 2 galactose-binding domain-containing protein n=1 Tax=Alistipes sp. An116 TaxID=1965546 RepID=UPI000B37A233|nr:sugar-binding domain-containing protein [Alistipes sp. An116]OUQ53961.1 hypothetical protein B5E60_05325 [Alistipes sp. An116]